MTKKIQKAVVVLSGGLDSSVLLAHVYNKHNYTSIYTLTFDYGQRHKKEIQCAKTQSVILGAEHKIIELSFIKDLTVGASALTDESISIPTITEVMGDPQPITYVPNRNMILLSIAASYAESIEADDVFYGAQAHDTYSGYWDASPEFLPAINSVLNLNRKHKITILAPFMNMKKPDIIKYGNLYGVDYSKTWTCYAGKDLPCGKCPTCSDRIKAFMDAELIDPLEYEISIPWKRGAQI